MRNQNINHDLAPSTTPEPETIINLPIDITPGAAGILWHDAVIAGHTVHFFNADGSDFGRTGIDAELRDWLSNWPPLHEKVF